MSDGNGKEPFFQINSQFDVSHILDRIQENLRLRKVLNLPEEGQPGGKPLPPSQAALKDLDFLGLDAVWEKWLYVDSPFFRVEGPIHKRAAKKTLNTFLKGISSSQYHFNCLSKQLGERLLQSVHTMDYNIREINHCVMANERHWSALEEGLTSRQNGLESVVNRSLEETSRFRVEMQAQMMELREAVNGLRGRVDTAETAARREKERADSLEAQLETAKSRLATLANEVYQNRDQNKEALAGVQASLKELNNRNAALESQSNSQLSILTRQADAIKELNNASDALMRRSNAQKETLEAISKQSELAVNAVHRISETQERLREGFMRTEGKTEELSRVTGSLAGRVAGVEKEIETSRKRMDEAIRQIAENSNRSHRNEEWLKLVAERAVGTEKGLESLAGRTTDAEKQIAENANRGHRNEEWLKLLSDRIGTVENRESEHETRLRGCETSGDEARRAIGDLKSAAESMFRCIETGENNNKTLTERVDGNERWLKLVAEKEELFNQRLEETTERMTALQESLHAGAERTEGVEKWLALVAGKADASENWRNETGGRLANLEARVQSHEEWLKVNTDKIESLQGWNQSLDERLRGADAADGELSKRMASLEDHARTWREDATRLQSVVAAVNERMANAEKWTGTLASRLDGWEDWCGKLHTRLQAQETREDDRQKLNNEMESLRQNSGLLAERLNGHEQWLKGIGERLDGTERWVDLASKKTDTLGERLVKVRREVLSEMRYLQSERRAADFIPRILSPEEYAKKAASMTDGLRVNVGSGNVTFDDYINVDSRPLEGVDVTADVLNLPFEAGSIAEIYNAHLIEHFSRDLMKNRILPYWFSLLKPGGKIRVVCPDWDAILLKQSTGEIDSERAVELTFGSQEYEGNLHLTMYGVKSLTETLTSAGFRHVEVAATNRDNDGCPEMELTAIRPITAGPEQKNKQSGKVSGKKAK